MEISAARSLAERRKFKWNLWAIALDTEHFLDFFLHFAKNQNRIFTAIDIGLALVGLEMPLATDATKDFAVFGDFETILDGFANFHLWHMY